MIILKLSRFLLSMLHFTTTEATLTIKRVNMMTHWQTMKKRSDLIQNTPKPITTGVLSMPIKAEYDQALADCTKAIELDPQNATFYYEWGNAFYQLGEFEKALLDYGRTIELTGELAEAYCGRGETYKALGQQEQAIADFEQCLEETDNPYWQQVAQQALKELQGE